MKNKESVKYVDCFSELVSDFSKLPLEEKKSSKLLRIFEGVEKQSNLTIFAGVLRKIRKEFPNEASSFDQQPKEHQVAIEGVMRALSRQLFTIGASLEFRETILQSLSDITKTSPKSISDLIRSEFFKAFELFLVKCKGIDLSNPTWIPSIQEEIQIHSGVRHASILCDFLLMSQSFHHEKSGSCLQSQVRVLVDWMLGLQRSIQNSTITRNKPVEILIDGAKVVYSLLSIAPSVKDVDIRPIVQCADSLLDLFKIYERVQREALNQAALLYTRVAFHSLNVNPTNFNCKGEEKPLGRGNHCRSVNGFGLFFLSFS